MRSVLLIGVIAVVAACGGGSGIDNMQAAHSISAAFGDYDLDGDLDLFVAHWATQRDFMSPGDTEHLWRNDTDATGITFQSVSESAGISPTILTLQDRFVTNSDLRDYTFAPTFARINNDLYPDILSVADFNYSQYFINDQLGAFVNSTDIEVIKDGNGMGSMVADYDNDGDLGIYHTNGWPLDDGYDDFSTDSSRVFVADGAGQFEQQSAQIGLIETEEGRGVVCADLDNDGDVDILQLHRSDNVAATLWRNDADSNNFLSVKLNGAAANAEAAGTRITITVAGATQMREIPIASNFVSQNPTVQGFGLGGNNQVDNLSVQWPDGRTTTLLNVQGGQLITVNHPDL